MREEELKQHILYRVDLLSLDVFSPPESAGYNAKPAEVVSETLHVL